MAFDEKDASNFQRIKDAMVDLRQSCPKSKSTVCQTAMRPDILRP